MNLSVLAEYSGIQSQYCPELPGEMTWGVTGEMQITKVSEIFIQVGLFFILVRY